MAFCCALPLLRSIWLAGTEKISLTEPPYGTDEGFLHRYGMSLEDLESLVKQRLSENAIRLEEDSSDGETIGLAVGETFSTDVILVFSVVRHSTQQRDAVLQEAARTQLRISESNSQQVAELFKDLSARLVSIHTERDCFVITFKTVEEIWKFSSHLALGHVAHSLENFLFDQTFWLDTTLINDVKICVSASEEHLATVYLGLLLQEGSFYAKALVNTSGLGDEDFSTRKNDLMLVRNIGLQNQWEGMVLSTGRCGLVPVEAVQPLSYPFYQWFLKTYPGNAGCPPPDNHHFPTSIGTGSCIALVDSKTLETDELSFKKGDRIEVLGFLLSSLDWFVGKNISTGKRGFVQKKQVEPVHVRPLDAWLLFVSEDEMKSLTLSDPSDGQGCQSLLGELLKSDISTVYRLNRLAGCEFPDVKNKPKPEDRDSQRVLGRSPSEKLQNGLRDDPSKEASPCSLPGQLLAAQALSCFYERVLPNHSCCILYYEHCLTLSQQLKNKQLEGSLLDILSELYLSLHAEKMYTTSLDYTKQSLRISIDLGMKDKEAKAWLRAGKTYYRMGEDELVEMYLQAAVQIAQKTKNTHFILRIYEEAGDVFYEGDRNRQMAINFYKDGAICLARSMGNLDTELRLVNKLVDLHVAMKQFEEALPHANLAVRLSSFTGDQLKERSSLHRLASVHFSLEQYELAENYYLKALSFTPLLLNKADQASYFAKVYYKLGQLTLHKLKDAFDASGYFQLALAAALEDKQAESLICTRLGEIYSSFLPDEEKAHFFFSNVQTLKMDTTVSDDTRLQQR
ncbi:SH3 domain and tetratricopeptide repeat-containing protein 2 isoform X3 [Polypterus senegalus]|uniref:SH3 domain and tetratricopeptide repeat-containing protein 2 isoform X3 n=1 Tax=Polypterus senegalus TaxID=55291 RepID=UPI0019648D38|nr:SH3 domain and tetratricopeptide repeat-containing protein 2 isoform X3 [Polypterus senegalus]